MPRALALVAALALAGDRLACAAAQNGSPDLVVVVADDLGWEEIALLPTPSVDALAGSARVFSRFYVDPADTPTHFALQFGAYAGREQLGAGIVPGDLASVGAPTERIALPRALRLRDYRSACFGAWPLTGESEAGTLEAPRLYGYEQWRAGVRAGLDTTAGEDQSWWQRVDDGLASSSGTYTAEAITDAFLEWWQEPTTRPRLVLVSYTTPAAPFDAPPAYLLPPGTTVGPAPRDRYEAAVTALDHELGRLVAGLDLTTTTLVVLGDGGAPASAPPPSAWFQGYGGSPWEGGVRVPLLVAGAHTTPGWSHRLTHAVDVAATLVELSRAPDPPHGYEDGVSFAPDLKGTVTSRPPVLSLAFDPNGQPLPLSERYCVVAPDGKKLLFDGQQELVFDLAIDPFETAPLPAGPATTAIADALRAVKQAIVP